MEQFEADLTHHLEPFPPHVPEGWFQGMPFSISRLSPGRETGVKVCPIVVSYATARQYTVQLRQPHSFRQVYLDAEGQQHASEPGYKLPNPPTFERFEDAVAVANAYLDR